MNRRGFLGLLTGAIAIATTGITSAPPVPVPIEYASGKIGRVSGADVLELPASSALTQVDARHLYTFDLERGAWWHRIDVIAGRAQWSVDILGEGIELDAERELAPALALLEDAIDESGYRVGQVFKYSVDQWHDNRDAQTAWQVRQVAALNA